MPAATKSYLDHDELSKKDKEKLKTLKKWLCKKNTKFEDAPGGFKRYINSLLR